MARQAAFLILAVHGIDKPTQPVDNEFYRQALDLDLRGKREFAGEILAAMGGISKFQFSRFKALLQLSDEALEMADRYNIDEGHLRPVTALSSDDQAEMIRQIIKFNLSSKQVKEMCESEEKQVAGSSIPSRTTLHILRMIRSIEKSQPEEIVNALIQQEKDADLIRRRLSALKGLITEMEK